MRLTSVTADNMLSMERASLEPDDTLTVIVGPNGAGKSNIVRLVTLAGLALEWLEERNSRLPGPEMTQPARSAVAAFAASRFRSSHRRAPLRVEIGLDLGAEDVEDMAVFLRAATVSTLMANGDPRLGQSLSAWAERSITPAAVADLASGALVLYHVGSPDAPWEVSWEFQFAGQRCRWGLSDAGGGQVSVLDADPDVRSANASQYVQLREAILGRPASFKPGEVPEMPEFSLNLLLGKDGVPGEVPLVQANGGNLNTALGAHRAFAEMAEIAPWVQQPNRVYSLAWLLRRVCRRGLVFVGEQLRGIGTMSAPPRAAGHYSVAEFASRAPSFEPHALPLRLARLKNGSHQERSRFRQIQELFADLASGRGVELSFQIAQAGDDDSQTEVAVTILVTEHDASADSSWELPIQLCGAGTWEALVLAEALVGPDQVVIMDEPALNLHPGWQQKLLTLLKERTGQSLLITHSPYLLPVEDEGDIYRIVRISRVAGATRVSRASCPVADPRAVIRDYSMSADARALLFASGAVLVEGETELGALPLWFAKSTSAARLGDPRKLHLAFYSVGGENQFKATLILLAALQIPWVIVCDGGPLRPDKGGNHIFRQIAGAGAASLDLRKWIESFLDESAKASGPLSFADVKDEASRNRVFTLAPDWDRAKDENGITAESFEAFIRSAPGLTGQLALARAEVGTSKVRQGRWLAENQACPPAVDELYAEIVKALSPAAEKMTGQGE
jgi:predicted ATPase